LPRAAGPVVDDEILAEQRRQLDIDGARDDVIATAGRERHD